MNIYLQGPDNDKIELKEDVNPEVLNKMNELKKKYNLPEELYELYLKNQSLRTNIVFNEEYYSVDIDRIIELREYYPHFIDLFWRYMGMGHMEFISFCIYSKKFFKRPAGGSNGYERELNYLEYKDYKLDNNKKYYEFNEIYDIIKNQ